MAALKDEYFRQLIEACAVPTNFVDRQGIVRYANRASARLMGSSPERLIGTPGVQLVSGGHRRLALEAMEATLGGESQEEAVDLATLAGPVRSRVVTVPVREGGEVIGLFASAFVVDHMPLHPHLPLAAAAPEGAEPLSTRESEILSLLRAGKHPKDIAQLLGISVYTARNHVRAVCRKHAVHSVVELLSLFASPGARRAG